MNTQSPKIIVAVHGVGDQVMSETVQKAINRICCYHGEKMGVPLGKIKALSVDKDPYERNSSKESGSEDYQCKPFQMRELLYDGELGNLSFVEVHWADLAREMDKNGFLLEEAKSWSRTIIERLPKRYVEAKSLGFERLRLILGEMVETIRTLGNLFKISALMGLFKFDLAKILNSYLGDVQIVTEFEKVREKILARFKNTMKNLPDNLDVYIVAHSEGTVVAVLSLLQEMNKPKDQQPDWLNQVRGVMTIGSPLDKHLLLWRELFEPRGPKSALKQKWQPKQEGSKIEWRNYYDNGDPIGFELEGLRRWLNDNGWTAFNFTGSENLKITSETLATLEQEKLFSPDSLKKLGPLIDKLFNDEEAITKATKDVLGDELTRKGLKKILKYARTPIHDHGFTKYYFPGKAHNDYWGDSHAFGHFIQTVVYEGEIRDCPDQEKAKFLPAKIKNWLQKEKAVDYATPPKTKTWPFLVSYVTPYLGLIVLMGIAVYVLHKALNECLNNGKPENTITVLRNVCGIASLLAGMTVFARIPRLTTIWYHRWLTAPISFAVGALGYYQITCPDERSFLSHNLYVGIDAILAKIVALFAWFRLHIALGLPENPRIGSTTGMILIALGIVILSWVAEFYFPKWGLRTLIILGGVAIALILIATAHGDPNEDKKSFWPVVLATAFALYLWQLIALVFDLVFVWHRYVRHWRELGFSKWVAKELISDNTETQDVGMKATT